MQTHLNLSQCKIVNFIKDAKFHEMNENDIGNCEINDKWEFQR